ncbi:MAG: DMT family transporter [Proteobacteria bacterium]|nr:DMT family transporter [Pseudomonadota bacterium]
MNPNAWNLAWVGVVLIAALAQTARNAAQRSLTGTLGTWSATLVRFLYGLPFAAACLALLYLLPGAPTEWPRLSAAYLGWLVLGAVSQVAATGALLKAMQARNFAIAVTLSKTEVLQIALFGAVALGEVPTPAMIGAMALASLGVALLAWPRRGAADGAGLARWLSPSAGWGLACGAAFAVATVAYRAAALELGASSALLSAAWGVTLAQAMQTLGLGGWVAWRQPGGLAPVLRAWRVSLLAGAMGALASLAWFAAYALHTAAAVRTVGMVEVLFSLMVSRRLFREHLSGFEWAGLALVLLGIAWLLLRA